MNIPIIQDQNWLDSYRQQEAERLESQAPNPLDHIDRCERIEQCLKAIDRMTGKQPPHIQQRFRDLFRLRLMEELSLEECGVELKICRERVRQLERKLLRMIQQHFKRLEALA